MPAARASISTFSRMYSVSVPFGVQRKPMSRADVAEPRHRAAHVRDALRRRRDLVRVADRLRVLEDRVQHGRADREAELGLDAAEDRVGRVHVGRAR